MKSHSRFGSVAIITRIINVLVVTLGYCETIRASSTTTPKIWLSSYGYSKDLGTKEEQFVFPASANFQSEENFQNGYVVKMGNNFHVTIGFTAYFEFTCEAAEPIFWSFSQILDQVSPFPELVGAINFRTSDVLSSLATPSSPSIPSSFKSILAISMPFDNDLISLAKIPKNQIGWSWNFTCHTTHDVINNSSSVILHTGQVEAFGGQRHRNPQKMTPEDKIILSFLKVKDADTELKKTRNITTLHLDDAMLRALHTDANKHQIVLGVNETLPCEKDIMKLGEDGLQHFNMFLGNKTKPELVEYGVDENIYDGDKIQIFCLSLIKFYSFGAYIKVDWKNGTSTILEEEVTEMQGIKVSLNTEQLANHSIYWDDKNQNLINNLMYTHLLFYLTKPFQASSEMESVHCNMPLWSAEKAWEKISRKINIHPK